MAPWVPPLVIWLPLFGVAGWLVFLGPAEGPGGKRAVLRERMMERLPAVGMWSLSLLLVAVGLAFFSTEGMADLLWISVGFAVASSLAALWYYENPWW